MLRPTELQERISHFPWIDLFPSSRLRDNLIAAFMQRRINHEKVVNDLIGCLFDGGEGMRTDHEESRYVDTQNGPPDLGKWWFLLIGCVDVIAATNKWRRLRGEKEVSISISNQL
jgi:hypothetical protein